MLRLNLEENNAKILNAFNKLFAWVNLVSLSLRFTANIGARGLTETVGAWKPIFPGNRFQRV